MRGRTLFAAIGSAVVTTALFVSPAGAAPSTDDAASAAFDRGVKGDAQQTIAATYRKTYPDLSAKAAKAAAAVQVRSQKLKDAMAQRRDTYGGAWFDPYTASYHVAVTDQATADGMTAVGQNLKISVKTHLVTRSLAQLETEAAALRTGTSDLAKAAGGYVGIDVKSNEVVVTVPASSTGSRLAAPAGVRIQVGEHAEGFKDACNSRADCDNSLRSGPVLRRAGAEMCSAGFTARDGNDNRWMMTAGHCLANLGEMWSTGTTTQRDIGPMTDAIDSGAMDAGAILVTNPFYTGSRTGIIYISATSTAPVKGTATLVVGDTACLSARIQDPGHVGNPCGTIGSLSDPNRRGLLRVDGYDACHGDSGGGWYVYNGNRYVAGLHSRSSDDGCNAGSNPASYVSAYTSFWTGLMYETS